MSIFLPMQPQMPVNSSSNFNPILAAQQQAQALQQKNAALYGVSPQMQQMMGMNSPYINQMTQAIPQMPSMQNQNQNQNSGGIFGNSFGSNNQNGLSNLLGMIGNTGFGSSILSGLGSLGTGALGGTGLGNLLTNIGYTGMAGGLIGSGGQSIGTP